MASLTFNPTFAIDAALRNPDLVVLPVDAWVKILQFVEGPADDDPEGPESFEQLRSSVKCIIDHGTPRAFQLNNYFFL